MRDFVVVGGGIAGIAIAELLQRSGRSVLLLEAKDRLLSGASADAQGWFHTGALYAPLPQSTFFRILVGNLDDLFGWYSCFDNMNLRVDRSLYTSKLGGWFGNSTNFYAYVSPWAPEVPWHMKAPWWVALRRGHRRLAWFERLDFLRELSAQVQTIERRVSLQLVRRSGDLGMEMGRLSRVLKSRDRTMDGPRIAIDLLRSFVGHGGELRLNARVSRLERGQLRLAEESGGGVERARHVIVCVGSATQELTGVQTRIFRSTLIVAVPALTSLNFVRATPRIAETINHLYHRVDDLEYSVFGNALYRRPDDVAGKEEMRRISIERLERTFPGQLPPGGVEAYEGTKTEVVGVGYLRNYQYHIIDRENCTVALPGKMTLGFSLAVNVARHFGIEPLRSLQRLADEAEVAPLVAKPRHLLLAQRLQSGAARTADGSRVATQLPNR